MRKMFFLIVSLSILMPLTASATTEQLAIGVFDFIISRTDLKVVKCESHSCNYVSTDNAIKMELKRATLKQHVSKDLNFLLDISFDSKLFKSGLLVQYYNDTNLIRVYLKGADITIEATRKDEIKQLQAWLDKILKLVK
jgi:hypothetical protein